MPQEVFDPVQRKMQVKKAKQAAGVGIAPIPTQRIPPLRQSLAQLQATNAATIAGHNMGPPTFAPKTAEIIRDLRGPLLNSKLKRQNQDFDSTEAQLAANQKVMQVSLSLQQGRLSRDQSHATEAARPTAPAQRGAPLHRAGARAAQEQDRALARGAGGRMMRGMRKRMAASVGPIRAEDPWLSSASGIQSEPGAAPTRMMPKRKKGYVTA